MSWVLEGSKSLSVCSEAAWQSSWSLCKHHQRKPRRRAPASIAVLASAPRVELAQPPISTFQGDEIKSSCVTRHSKLPLPFSGKARFTGSRPAGNYELHKPNKSHNRSSSCLQSDPPLQLQRASRRVWLLLGAHPTLLLCSDEQTLFARRSRTGTSSGAHTTWVCRGASSPSTTRAQESFPTLAFNSKASARL